MRNKLLFLVTGLFAFLAYDNFKANHDTRAWIFTGLAAAFYAGNIYGSITSANVFNTGIQLSFENDIKIFLNKNDYFVPKPEFLCK